ncbi:hypothetical protein [Pyrococcus kukulkanii]|uniref:hypothetical protein n=1 Tax=Pyrococcus kukulkanii TaxID=1609559 RepID=UPI0035626E40
MRVWEGHFESFDVSVHSINNKVSVKFVVAGEKLYKGVIADGKVTITSPYPTTFLCGETSASIDKKAMKILKKLCRFYSEIKALPQEEIVEDAEVILQTILAEDVVKKKEHVGDGVRVYVEKDGEVVADFIIRRDFMGNLIVFGDFEAVQDHLMRLLASHDTPEEVADKILPLV